MLKTGKKLQARRGLSLVELVAILVIMSLLVGLGLVPAVRFVEKSKYDADADILDSFLQNAVAHAVLHSCKVEVVFSLEAGTFEAYEIFESKDSLLGGSASAPADIVAGAVAGPLVSADSNSELILEGEPLEMFFIDSIRPEDGAEIMDGEVVVRADGGGWVESFIVALASEDEENWQWLRCDRGTVGVRTYRVDSRLPVARDSLD
ncbi:MAG: hypothetical protein JW745_00565 [Sedimentisphaerales bacterium]|nr:hypothetical protein [Sedimentisphaerales bacterium]